MVQNRRLFPIATRAKPSDASGILNASTKSSGARHEAGLWADWPVIDALVDVLANAPSKAPGFEFQVLDLVHSEELKTKLALLFERIARLEPEALQEAEKLVSKLERKYAPKGKSAAPPPSSDDLTTAPELFNRRASKKEDIVRFIERVYGPWLDGYRFTIAKLRRLDPSAGAAVGQYRAANKKWPEHVKLPTVAEVNSRLIKEGRIESIRQKMREQGYLTKEEEFEMRRLIVARTKRRPRRQNNKKTLPFSI